MPHFKLINTKLNDKLKIINEFLSASGYTVLLQSQNQDVTGGGIKSKDFSSSVLLFSKDSNDLLSFRHTNCIS